MCALVELGMIRLPLNVTICTSSLYMLYYCFSLVFNSSAIHFMRVLP